MKTFFLDTSTEKSFFAIANGEEIEVQFLPEGAELSKRLTLEVSTFLENRNFIPERICVGKGPGSLTGVRVGLSFARALAFGWKIPCLEFCSLQVCIPEEMGPFAALIDARSGGIYIRLGNQYPHSIQWGEPLLLSPEAVAHAIANIPTLLSPHPHLIARRLAPFQNGIDIKPSHAVGLSRFLKEF